MTEPKAPPPPLEGFAFSGYRSFHGEMQVFAPLKKVNLVAGQNNAGKSNVLRFLLSAFGGSGPLAPEGLDVPSGSDGQVRFALPRLVTREIILELSRGQSHGTNPQMACDEIMRIFGLPEARLTDGPEVWFQYVLARKVDQYTPARYVLDPDWISSLAGRADQSWLAAASMVLTQGSAGPEANMLAVAQRLDPLTMGLLPPMATVEAFRQIQPHSEDSLDYKTGKGLIAQLQRLAHPAIDRLADSQRFEAINRFVRTVLDDETASITVPSAADTIHVHRSGLVLPLEHLGTGIHQVIILAAAATLLENTLICIEEPEVHLHPLLQRKLVRYLQDETTNQYLIATHSAHILDYTRAEVFHIQNKPGNGSKVKRARTNHDLSALCADLGYRASDLLQANAVIWVEGPSDRLYLRRWLELHDEALIEGIHYSIMFYGGALLNHLSVDDPMVDDFISLRLINRNLAVMIDSDKKRPQDRITPTKKRVQREFAQGPGLAWVTAGRTVENYVPTDILIAATKMTHPKATLAFDGSDKYGDPLEGIERPNKVRIAHLACDAMTTEALSHLDLRARIGDLAGLIRLANGMPTASAA